MMQKTRTGALVALLTLVSVLDSNVFANRSLPASEAPRAASLSADQVAIHDGLLDPALVWSPAVEELDWSAVRPDVADKPWLTGTVDSDRIVVRGVADSIDETVITQYLLPRLVSQLGIKSNWQQRVAERSIRYELKRSPIIADRFQQTFYKTVGDEQHVVFTREAVLLDLSKANLAQIARPIRSDLRGREHLRGKAFNLAAIIISISSVACWMGYTYLNRVTQGYYVWPIRLTTAALMVGSVSLAAGVTLSILTSL